MAVTLINILSFPQIDLFVMKRKVRGRQGERVRESGLIFRPGLEVQAAVCLGVGMNLKNSL